MLYFLAAGMAQIFKNIYVYATAVYSQILYTKYMCYMLLYRNRLQQLPWPSNFVTYVPQYTRDYPINKLFANFYD